MQAPPAPANGDVTLLEEYSDTVAMFTCDTGHVVTGDQVLGCVDGVKWNGTVPECKQIVSDQPWEEQTSAAATTEYHNMLIFSFVIVSTVRQIMS